MTLNDEPPSSWLMRLDQRRGGRGPNATDGGDHDAGVTCMVPLSVPIWQGLLTLV